ncbi:polyphenol oxidase family protein [Desulfovibrio sp. OttesenSCG-928-C06]|nr:polyphenol oxidase family protein [Desulfovibrio sp. OttesenSCG-928-C06]
MDRAGDMFRIIPFRFPGVEKVHCFFTTALYGNISLDSVSAASCVTDASGAYAATAARRKDLSGLLGFDSWTELRQVHGDTLLLEPDSTPFDAPSTLEADGCATSCAGQAMISKSADCQQILLAHNSGKYVAALHSGWRGNAIDFPVSAVECFCSAYNVKAQDVLAVRGPSLGPGAAEFVNFEREWPPQFAPWFDRESKRVNLWELLRQQLIRAGLKAGNIYGIDLCTYTCRDFLFSHRAGHGGRQAALIFIR